MACDVTDKNGEKGSGSVTVEVLTRSLVCSGARASVGVIWPVNHKFVPTAVLGVTDSGGE